MQSKHQRKAQYDPEDAFNAARGIVYGGIFGCAIWIALIIIAAIVIGGCSTVGRITDRAAKEIGNGIAVYCEETIPDVREVFRDKVNAAAAPHSLEVYCVDGEILTTTSDDA